MTTDEKLQHFLDICMEDAREKSSRLYDEYAAALEQSFEEHKKEAARRLEMQLQGESEKLDREMNKKLALAQPALSAQIKTLEHYYGAKLIQTARGKRQLTLTEAGEAFLGKARQICHTEETILLDMQSFNKKASGTLRFSVSPAKSTYFINTYLRPFAAAYPEICFQYREEAVSAQTRHIAENSSDFAFANAPLPSPQLFAAHKTQKEYFYAVYSPQANCGLDPQQPLTPKQLQNIPVCCNFGCYSLLRKACLKHGFMPKIRFIATTNTAALAFVQDGSGIAIVSAGGRDDFPQGLQQQLLADDELYFEQTLFWSKKDRLSATAQLFLDFYLAAAKTDRH